MKRVSDRPSSPDEYSDTELALLSGEVDDFRPISPRPADTDKDESPDVAAVSDAPSVEPRVEPAPREERVEITPRWTDSAAIRIRDEAIRKHRKKKKSFAYCKVCKVKVGQANDFRYRRFVNTEQLRQHEGGKEHLRQIRKQNEANQKYYCKVCNKPFSGPTGQHSYETHLLGRRHRTNVEKKRVGLANLQK